MKKVKETENNYFQLPRFVEDPEEIEYINDKYLPALVREYEWNDLKFTLVISPARVRDEQGRERHYYPGQRERLIETALRRLAVAENGNFQKDRHELRFTLRELINELYSLDGGSEYSSAEIQMGIKILADTKYELLKDRTEIFFRPIEQLESWENNINITYRAYFSLIFFGEQKQFDSSFPIFSR